MLLETKKCYSALGWPDAFPHTDLGVRKALGNLAPNEILALSREWAAWRSYAAVTLWSYLSGSGAARIKETRP